MEKFTWYKPELLKITFRSIKELKLGTWGQIFLAFETQTINNLCTNDSELFSGIGLKRNCDKNYLTQVTRLQEYLSPISGEQPITGHQLKDYKDA